MVPIIPIKNLSAINWQKVLTPMVEGAMGPDYDKVNVIEIHYLGHNIAFMVVNLGGEAGKQIREDIFSAREG